MGGGNISCNNSVVTSYSNDPFLESLCQWVQFPVVGLLNKRGVGEGTKVISYDKVTDGSHKN